MELTWMTWVWRIGALILSIIGGYFGIRLYVLTSKGSKGWVYSSLKGILLFFWSLSALLFVLVDIPYLRHISGIIFLVLMSLVLPQIYTKLLEDFGAERPQWLSVRNVLITVPAVFFTLLLGNIFTGNFENPLVTILSVSHLTLGISALITVIPTFILAKKTKQLPWKMTLIFALVIGIALNVGQYHNNCCSEAGELSDNEICANYDLDYTKVYNLPCNEELVSLGRYYQVLLLLGVTMLPAALYQLTARLKM